MAAKESLRGVSLGFIDSWEDAQTFMRWASEDRGRLCYSVDTETTGLDPYDRDASIRLIQIGDEMTGWAMPFNRWSGLVAEVLRRVRIPIVYHNCAFDAKWLSVHDPLFPLRWDRLQDTMIIARIAEPHKSAALKRLTAETYGSEADLGQRALHEGMEKNGWTWATVPYEWETYGVYSAMDVVLTARLWRRYQDWLAVHREVYELEMQARRICTNMELKGFRVDLDYVGRRGSDMIVEIAEIEKHVKDEHGFELGSTTQLADWIEKSGGKISKWTPSGRVSVDADALQMLAAEPDTPEIVRGIAQLSLEHRKLTKIYGTYLSNFGRFARDGVVHAQINTIQARTGRMSITDPALQTLHRGDPTVRDAFIAMNSNEKLVTCDADQIEARLFANFSRDKMFQSAFDGPLDFFVNLARQVYSDNGIIKSDPRRAIIKSFLYGRLYGAGIMRLALTAGVPMHVMKSVDVAMNEQFPGMRKFQEAVATEAIREGHITTPMGRQLVIEDSSKAYVATNYLIQGHAAELIKQALINADNVGLGEYLTLPVHDEIIMSVPADICDDAAQTLKECMTFSDPELYPVPLTAGPEGPFERWGDKVRGK